MAEQSSRPDGTPDGAPSALVDGVYEQLKGMILALWSSRQRNKIFLLAGALVAIVGATAYSQVRLNAWNRPFYDALSRKDLP